MGNSLLDFVMSVVRDPAAAARYAADPAGALAAADLVGVTTDDVDNLIPMVTDSLAMTTPGFAVAAPSGSDAANVWSSGAATAAFDAFGSPPPRPPDHAEPVIRDVHLGWDGDGAPSAYPHGRLTADPADPVAAPPGPVIPIILEPDHGGVPVGEGEGHAGWPAAAETHPDDPQHEDPPGSDLF